MADKAIKRDSFETIEEAGYGALKGGVGALVGAFVVGALLVAAPVIAITAIAGGAAGLAGLFTGGSAVALGLGAAAMGMATTLAYGAPLAAIGGLFGLVKGAGKASRENVKYAEKANEKLMGKEAELAAVHNNAMQVGYQAAAQQFQPQAEALAKQAYEAGKQEVLADLEKHAHHEKHEHHDHHHHDEKSHSHVADVAKRREQTAAAAAAGAQIG